LVQEGCAGDPVLLEMAGGSAGVLGRGGMRTKLQAAKIAARSGADTLIVSGREPQVLQRVAQGEAIGTLLHARQAPITARKRWLASHLQMRGRLHLDQGAAHVLREQGKSLLAVGVQRVEGEFERGEVVACFDPQGNEIARGLINYSAADTQKILGQPSEKIMELLGYVDEPELIHRDNLVLV